MANAPDRFSERLRRRALTRLLGHAPYENARPDALSMLNHVSRTETRGPAVRSPLADNIYTFMPPKFKERELKPHVIDKILSSKWVDGSHVVFGTHCNRIVKSNLYTGEYTDISTIAGHLPGTSLYGFLAMDINPSQSLIALNGYNEKCIAVYRLSSFDPLFLGEYGHTKQIFDVKWITDEYCVTGSEDGTVALWHVDPPQDTQAAINNFMAGGAPAPQFAPKAIYNVQAKDVRTADCVTAVAFKTAGKDMGILSRNGRLHTWDISTFTQKQSAQLRRIDMCMCMDYDPGRQYYAVGTVEHIEIMDRDLKPVISVQTPDADPCIFSISINRDIITIGTGRGIVYFYDVTAGKYLTRDDDTICSLTTGAGYLHPGGPGLPHVDNAVYTHCYDDSGSRLFTAGGPFFPSLIGSYAALWE